MSKKNIFILASGYLLWGLVNSLFSKKKPEDLKAELLTAKDKKEDFKILFDNFVDTHINLIKWIEKEVMTEENKQLFFEKKDQLVQLAESYKVEGMKLLEEVKVKGKGYIIETLEKLEQLYNEKKDELDSIKNVSPEKIQELKENLLATFNELKEKIKK